MIDAGVRPMVKYPGARNRWQCRCLKCKRIVFPDYSSVVNAGQNGCSYCAGKKVDPESAFKLMVSAKLNPLVAYLGANTPWPCICEKCGKTVSPTYSAIRIGQGGCKYCTNKGLDYNSSAFLYLMTHQEFRAHKVGVGNHKTRNNRIKEHIKTGWILIENMDFQTGDDIKNLKYNCYWCRYKFDSTPIGCPVKYISKKAVKNYYSEVSKDFYTIKENITRKRSQMLHDNRGKFVFTHIDNNACGGGGGNGGGNCSINISNKDHYSTDGIFCSFNCCKAFIKDNKHNKLYENSDILLNKLYQDMYNVKTIVINPSPHWRLLIEYGGYLTIQQFRDNFNKTTYESHGVIRNTDIFKPIATLFEEKLNF
jgi:hypothetical protein